MEKKIAFRIVTDGISASFHCEKTGIAVAKNEEKRHLDLSEQPIVAVDPGRRNIFTGVTYDSNTFSMLREEEWVKFKVQRISGRQYYEGCGFRKRSRAMARWAKNNKEIYGYNKSIGSSKTESLEGFKTHIVQLLQHLQAILHFNYKRRVHKLRWKTHMKKQKFESKLEKIFPKEAIITLGNGSFNPCLGIFLKRR